MVARTKERLEAESGATVEGHARRVVPIFARDKGRGQNCYFGTADRRDASRAREAARRALEEGRRDQVRAVYADPTAQVETDSILWLWSQFVAARPLTPEENLLIAVVDDARRGLSSGSPVKQREARRWFCSDDRSHAYAFATICDHFGVEPEYARRGLFGT